MNKSAIGGLIFLMLCAETQAGGLERSDQSLGILFEEGRRLELGIVLVDPDLSGVGALRSPGVATGNIAKDYENYRFAFKDDINAQLSYAIVYDEPYGSDVAYPTSSYFASGAAADVTTRALTGVLRYRIGEPGSALGGQFSVFGGPRAQYIRASANVPFVAGYSASSDSTVSAGYLAGLAWERPEFGMRVSLTYNSKIKSDLDTTETLGGVTTSTVTEIDTPESINLEGQTGINPKTLIYGSIRWVPWADFVVAPPVYTNQTGSPLAFFKDDRTTFRLGVGRKLTDDLSVFGELGYERSTGSGTTNLTPVDGFSSYTLGANYQVNKVRYTVAARYAKAGDAGTILGPFEPAGEFKGNSTWGLGFRVSFDLD